MANFMFPLPTTLGGFNCHPQYGDAALEQTYYCYSASSVDKPQVEKGDKALLPPSALKRLASSQMDYPMIFEIRNPATNYFANCGVLEFVANEGTIYLPLWIMESLLLDNGDVVKLKRVTLPKGTYVKLQPHKKDILRCSHPESVLNDILQKFSCLTVGHSIMVSYNNEEYYLDIVEAKPAAAISIVDTLCEVELAMPVDAAEEEQTFMLPIPSKRCPISMPSDQNGLNGADAVRTSVSPSPGKPSDLKLPGNASSPAPPSASSSAIPRNTTHGQTPVSSQGSTGSRQPFKPFTGVSRRLDGKTTASSLAIAASSTFGGTISSAEAIAKMKAESYRRSEGNIIPKKNLDLSAPTAVSQFVPKKISDVPSSSAQAVPKEKVIPSVSAASDIPPIKKTNSTSSNAQDIPKQASYVSVPPAQVTVKKTSDPLASGLRVLPNDALDPAASSRQQTRAEKSSPSAFQTNPGIRAKASMLATKSNPRETLDNSDVLTTQLMRKKASDPSSGSSNVPPTPLIGKLGRTMAKARQAPAAAAAAKRETHTHQHDGDVIELH